MNHLPPFQSFDAAFDFLTEYVKKERCVVIIDEYPYLAASDKSISSRLQSYIDGEWKDSKMYLILCGSSMSFMEHQVLGYQSPFYGRRTAQIKLLPFDYRTSACFVPDYSDEDKALVYGVTGGIPKYLELFRPELSVYENIIKLFFNSSGYLYEEPENLLKQELRDVSTYNAIIEAMASGAAKINEIATKIHSDTANDLFITGICYQYGDLKLKEFDRFYTVEASRNSTGLGLSIAKILTERMGGNISASYFDEKLYITITFTN